MDQSNRLEVCQAANPVAGLAGRRTQEEIGPMGSHDLTAEEIALRGKLLYQQLCPQLEPAHRGRFLVINVETGAYELGEDHVAVSDRAAAKHPGAPLFAVRIGYPTLGRMGASSPGSA
jgi:hypothetical protein